MVRPRATLWLRFVAVAVIGGGTSCAHDFDDLVGDWEHTTSFEAATLEIDERGRGELWWSFDEGNNDYDAGSFGVDRIEPIGEDRYTMRLHDNGVREATMECELVSADLLECEMRRAQEGSTYFDFERC